MVNMELSLLMVLLSFMRSWVERRILQGKLLIYWITTQRRRRRAMCSLGDIPRAWDLTIFRPRSRGSRRQKLKLVVHHLDYSLPLSRRFWMKNRPKLWWTTFNVCTDDESWRQHFRMSRATFEYLVDAVRPYLMRQVSNFREPIPVRKQVAVALWRLATGCDYRTLQELFGLGRSTSCRIVQEFIAAVIDSLKHKLLHLPTPQECRVIVQGFRDTWGFPQCVGSLDGTHIPVLAPSDHRNDYFNRKGWYSVICQAIVDHRYLFWDLDVGWPGKVHDARVLANSTVYHLAQNDSLFPDEPEQFGDIEVPLCLIGDPAYPLQSWLMKPYREGPEVTEQERYFNYRLSRARMTVECAFGRLKGRWRCLLKRNDHHISLIPSVVLCCGILHNLCERRGEVYDEDLNTNAVVQPERHDAPEPTRGQMLEEAQVIRDALCLHLSGNRF